MGQSALPLFKALRAFIPRCTIGTAPPDVAAAMRLSALTGGLTAAAWSRVLTELVDSGLLAFQFNKLRELRAALRGLAITNPANLALLAADWLVIEPFNTPAVAGGAAAPGRGRGRGRARGAANPAPAIPAIPGPASLRFLDLASLSRLENPQAPCPLEAWALLAGVLGPCSRRAIRADQLSFVFTSAELIKGNLSRYLGFSAAAPASDGALAVQLGAFLTTTFHNMTDLFFSDDAGVMHLQREALAAFRLYFGNAEERAAIMADRIHFVDDRAPTLTRFIIRTASSNQEAFQNQNRLADRLGLGTAPFAQRVPALESECLQRLALFTAAAQAPNADSTSITSAVIADVTAIVGQGGGGAAGAANAASSSGGAADGASFGSLREDQLQLCFVQQSFRACVEQVAACDSLTAAGRRDMIEAAFLSSCSIVGRLLLEGNEALARRHPVLSQLAAVRSDLGLYFGHILALNRSTGLVPERARKFSWATPLGEPSKLMKQWANCNPHLMDLYNGERGIYALKGMLSNKFQQLKGVNVLDFWCIPAALEDWREGFEDELVDADLQVHAKRDGTKQAW